MRGASDGLDALRSERLCARYAAPPVCPPELAPEERAAEEPLVIWVMWVHDEEEGFEACEDM